VDRSPAKPEDAETGATRQIVSAGATGRVRLRGKPQASAPEVLKDAKFEATRRSIAGKAGRCESRGNLGDASGDATEGVKSGATCNSTRVSVNGHERRGNLKLGRRQSLRMQAAGQLATSSRGATGRAEPRGLSARRSEGCGNRGNSKLHRGGLRTRAAGNKLALSLNIRGNT
jgi:hypothetical protein